MSLAATPASPQDVLRAWVLASRPKTLTAAMVPVAVGTAVAHASGALRPIPALAALWGAVWIQIGTNFANDAFDAEKGADTEERLGPLRAVQAGLLSAGAVKRGAAMSFGLATLAGLYLTWVAGWPVVAIGLLSVASGVLYTGGPYPLGYHGLGDVFVMVFFGFVAVCGTVFVQAGTVPELAIWASVPVGALATAVLVVNNVRDRHTDARVGKRSLAVRFGKRLAVAQYAVLLVLAYAVPVVLWARGAREAAVLLPLLTLPAGAALLRSLATREGRDLNPLLAQTALLLLAHGALFAAGISLGG